MDDCINCWYKVFCQRIEKFGYSCPCSLTLPDHKNILKQIDDITEDLHAQYD